MRKVESSGTEMTLALIPTFSPKRRRRLLGCFEQSLFVGEFQRLE
jgi:hypothetical protein